MLRFLDWFKGISFKNNHIHVATTGAIIPINKQFRHDVMAVAKIFLYFAKRGMRCFFTRQKPVGTLAFYPQTPGPWYNIWQVTRLASLKIEADMSKADYVFIFEDKTFSEYDKLTAKNLAAPKLNMRIDDISKERVADIFKEVFGYNLRIDPLTYKGHAIQKSNANGTHDGMIIDCPLAESDLMPGQTYQRLVDSTFDGISSEDLRIAYALGEIALVYHKHKPLTDRFGTNYLCVDVKLATDVFSEREIRLIIGFCETIGLDFGAVDVMRDKHDGRIYIVDVNKTCMPVLSLTLTEQIKSQKIIADALTRGLTRLPQSVLN